MTEYIGRQGSSNNQSTTGKDVRVTFENKTDTLDNTLPRLGKVKSVDGNLPDALGNVKSKTVENVNSLPQVLESRIYIKAPTGEDLTKVYAKDTELATQEALDKFTEFDLTKDTVIDGSNLDNITGGVFRVKATCTNIPKSGADGFLICSYIKNGKINQFFISDENDYFTRTKGTEWSIWEKLVSVEDLKITSKETYAECMPATEGEITNYWIESTKDTANQPETDYNWFVTSKRHKGVTVDQGVQFAQGTTATANKPPVLYVRFLSGTTYSSWKRLANTTELETRVKIDGTNGTATGVSALLNKLTTGDSDPVDNDYYISQYVNGGTTTTTYHRRPMSKVWNYIKGKLSSILGLTNVKYNGAARFISDAGSSNFANNIEVAFSGDPLTSENTTYLIAYGPATHTGAVATARAINATEVGKFIGKVKNAEVADNVGCLQSQYVSAVSTKYFKVSLPNNEYGADKIYTVLLTAREGETLLVSIQANDASNVGSAVKVSRILSGSLRSVINGVGWEDPSCFYIKCRDTGLKITTLVGESSAIVEEATSSDYTAQSYKTTL